jgi:hypothetical protein
MEGAVLPGFAAEPQSPTAPSSKVDLFNAVGVKGVNPYHRRIIGQTGAAAAGLRVG